MENATAALSATSSVNGMIGLSEKRDRMPDELSGGEQQRIAIVRALANKPSIVLADEPTGNLDSKTSKQIMNLLKKFNKEEGQTFVIITHDPRMVEVTDRTIQMMDGTIVNKESSNLSMKTKPEITSLKRKLDVPINIMTWLAYRQLSIEIRLTGIEKRILSNNLLPEY